jgi:hypothetical protein
MQVRHGALKASLIIGILWGCWHLPLWLTGTESHPISLYGPFVIAVITSSVMCTWLYNNTGGEGAPAPLAGPSRTARAVRRQLCSPWSCRVRPGRDSYSREQFSGLLVPFFQRSLNRGRLPAFQAMNSALKDRAERVADALTAWSPPRAQDRR